MSAPSNTSSVSSEHTTKTLKQLGLQLPVGKRVSGGAVSRSFEVWPFMMDHDAAWKKMCGNGSTVGDEVTSALAIGLKKWRDKSWSIQWPEDSKEWNEQYQEKVAALHASPGGDVLYAYFYLRYVSMGKELPVRLLCSGRRHKEVATTQNLVDLQFIDVKLDLETLDVIVLSDEDTNRTAEFTFDSPIELRGKMVKKVILHPVFWSAMESGLAVDYAHNYDILVLQSSIRTLVYEGEDKPEDVLLDEKEVRRCIPLRYVNSLRNTMAKVSGGPLLVVECMCPVCGHKNEVMYDYRYGSFFA